MSFPDNLIISIAAKRNFVISTGANRNFVISTRAKRILSSRPERSEYCHLDRSEAQWRDLQSSTASPQPIHSHPQPVRSQSAVNPQPVRSHPQPVRRHPQSVPSQSAVIRSQPP
jgi:hypothetical protein